MARLEGLGGVSSCLFYVPTAVDYSTAKAACAKAGYHLLTTAAKVKSALLRYVREAVVGNTSDDWWVGAERTSDWDATTTVTPAQPRWSWTDGTPADNLNCGGLGCGLWAAEQPDGTHSRLHSSSLQGGGAGGSSSINGSGAVALGFVCEREFVCPVGSLCAPNSDTVTPCPAGTTSAASGTMCTPVVTAEGPSWSFTTAYIVGLSAAGGCVLLVAVVLGVAASRRWRQRQVKDREQRRHQQHRQSQMSTIVGV